MKENTNLFVDRATGSILGLALGDALGTSVEFKKRDSFPPLDDIVGGGPFNLQPGEWTDDTSMTLCLIDSYLACGQHDASDQLNRYTNWWQHGENSATGTCFDIGHTVETALRKYSITGDTDCATNDELSAGNGSLMRIAPVAIFYSPYRGFTLEQALNMAKLCSQTTHAEQRCIDACQLMVCLLYKIFEQSDLSLNKLALLNSIKGDLQGLHPEIQAIANGKYFDKTRDEIKSSGFVVHSLEAALWCFYNTNTFKQGALLAANLGEDADTIAAIYSQLAGAFYGYKQLPSEWLKKLAWHDDIKQKTGFLATIPSQSQIKVFLIKLAQISLSSTGEVSQLLYEHHIISPYVNWPQYPHRDLIHSLFEDSKETTQCQARKIDFLSSLDLSECVKVITVVVRAERFTCFTLKQFIDGGLMQLWLNRLKEITEIDMGL